MSTLRKNPKNINMKFTIQEIKNYLLSQDSLGDIHYNLSEKNIIEANDPVDHNLMEEDEVKENWDEHD